ncbi:peptidylprolyl isomerase [Aerococcus kribbianus]|uniref:Foldase protein PrsA n=1 Tax=Aerococcus kribbianus TaxID=2999064 RepID=A0A9X3FVP7_9LACT|nr:MULTISPECIES: peptidylprolyl isomerase [unclassified Aerococcus]MCZ0717792.1 peptidylprolyl isomerase [Aerococcus sp. YH-aer221]MCZ0726079.1 peptidylprolyl isomerase [Aerococcus sp. YH-aer222]
MRLSKKIGLASLSLVSALALAACDQANSGDAIVTGKDIKITQEDFNQQLKDTSGSAVLQQMVLSDVFEKEVGEDKAKELQDQAKQQMALLKQQYKEDDKFKTVLASSGFDSEEAYQEQLYYYQLMSAAVSKNIPVSDEEVKAAYDNYEAPIEVSHILVKDEETAKNLIQQLDDGADFAELAKENSTDTSAANGGSLGEVSKGQMVKEFEDAAFQLDEGEYSKEPVKSEYGYHIIKVDKKKDKGSLEDEKGQLEDSIRQDKMQDTNTVKKVVQDLLNKYEIDIKDKDLEDALDDFQMQAEDQKDQDDKASGDNSNENNKDNKSDDKESDKDNESDDKESNKNANQSNDQNKDDQVDDDNSDKAE